MSRCAFSSTRPGARGDRAWAKTEALMQFELLKLLATHPDAMRAAKQLRRADAAARVHAQAEVGAAARGGAGERRAAAAGEDAGRGPRNGEEASGGRRKKSAARKAKDDGKLRARWVRKRSEAAVAAAGGGVRLGRVLACVGAFILQLRRLRAAREAAAMDDASGDDVLTAAANGAARDAPADEAPVLAPVPALMSAGEQPSAGEAPLVVAPGERTWAGVAAAPPAAAPAVAPAASPEKRRVEFGAEQSPAQRGRPVADGGCERQRERMRYMRELNARVHDPVKRVQAYADWDREWDSRHK